MQKYFNLRLFLISFIVLLAFVVRIFAISDNPPSLNWDEVSHGYNAYSILTTGMDEWGEKFPIIFKAYGDFKLPVYIYTLVPFIKIFGLNEFAVRLPSVLAGTITVLLTYLLVKQIFKKNHSAFSIEHLAIISAFLVAIEPWSLFLSRGAFEANLALCLFLAGLYFFFRFINSYNSYFLILASLFLSLTVWTYNSYRIFTPLILVVLFFLWKKEIVDIFRSRKSIIHYSLFIILFFVFPMFYQLFNSEGQARYNKVSIISEGSISEIIQNRENSYFPDSISRFIYNRPTYFIFNFIQNWIKHYSGKYLYFEGGSHYQFSVPNYGILYPVNIPFLIIGVFYLIKKRDRSAVFLLSLFYFGPIASSITREAPHVLRSITMLPSPMIITSFGFIKVLQYFGSKKLTIKHYSLTIYRRLFLLIYLVILSMSLYKYIQNYYSEYRLEFSWSWQYGYKQVIGYVKENYNNYDNIVITKKYGEPHEFLLFYWPWDTDKYLNDGNLNRFRQSDWYWVDGFDKFHFVNEWDIPSEEWQDFVLESGESVKCSVDRVRCLLVTDSDSVPKTWNKLESINFLDGSSAFEIYEN